MGREIRRVPKGWEHPRDDQGRFNALSDETFEVASKEWWEAAVKWNSGDVSEHEKGARKKYPWYWQWAGSTPDEDSYRPEFGQPANCYQIYETVSEGTPCSPVFESIDQMVEWMILPIDRTSRYNTGEDWQCMQGMTRIQAEKFCKSEWAPSLIFSPETGVIAGHRDK